jgi:hypothetical protein
MKIKWEMQCMLSLISPMDLLEILKLDKFQVSLTALDSTPLEFKSEINQDIMLKDIPLLLLDKKQPLED